MFTNSTNQSTYGINTLSNDSDNDNDEDNDNDADHENHSGHGNANPYANVNDGGNVDDGTDKESCNGSCGVNDNNRERAHDIDRGHGN